MYLPDLCLVARLEILLLVLLLWRFFSWWLSFLFLIKTKENGKTLHGLKYNQLKRINYYQIILSYVPPSVLVGCMFGCPLSDADSEDVLFFEGVTIRPGLSLTLGMDFRFLDIGVSALGNSSTLPLM
jgi:hypothetical protein